MVANAWVFSSKVIGLRWSRQVWMDIYRLVDPTPSTDERLPGLERAPQTRTAKHRETVSSWQIPSTSRGPVCQLSSRTCLLVPWGIAQPSSSHPRGQAHLQRSRTLRRPLSMMTRSQTTLWWWFPEGRSPAHGWVGTRRKGFGDSMKPQERGVHGVRTYSLILMPFGLFSASLFPSCFSARSWQRLPRSE